MNTSIVKNKNRIKITYTQGKEKWYAEFTKADYKKGLGWNQWGSSSNKLSETVDTTTKYVNEWIDEYMGG